MLGMMAFRGLACVGLGLGLAACGQDANADAVTAPPPAGAPALGGAAGSGQSALGGAGSGTIVTPQGGTGLGGQGGVDTGMGGASGGASAGAAPVAGSSAMAGAAGAAGASGGSAPGDPCGAGPWSCVPVNGGEPYGTHTIDVPAQQNWVNTGLYLKSGEQATLTESGSWQLSGSGKGIDHGTCKVGDMVARIGLYYKDTALTCVKGTVMFTAPKDGILFVGALAGNDLGETYESRSDASGQKTLKVESTAATVPTVQGDQAAGYAFNGVKSGWVEVWGEHVIVTLPASTASKDAQVMAKATQRLDDIYELEAELRGALPHHGQRIRFFPDGSQPGYMLAGNPVRMALTLVSGGDTTRISRAGEEGTDIWGFAHEMGHDFSFAPNGFWTYQEKTLESWCNLFSLYSLGKLGIPEHDATQDCSDESTGDYATWDAWGGLCFLRQFQFRYGWDFYKKYFQQIKDAESTNGDPWQFVHDQFNSAAGEDTTPIFDAWQVPH